jgi:hypothetical protein
MEALAQESAADAGISIAGLLVWLRLVANQLREIGFELQDLMIELDVMQQLMSTVPNASRSDHEVVAELGKNVVSWRGDLVATVGLTNDYITDITAGRPARP